MTKPVTLTIAALGGQGGGVAMNWMIDVAEASGMRVQATSVPGVAQRTGATIYYLEFAPRAEAAPVMALMPAPGMCDVVVASELVEAARMVQRGQRARLPVRNGCHTACHMPPDSKAASYSSKNGARPSEAPRTGIM